MALVRQFGCEITRLAIHHEFFAGTRLTGTDLSPLWASRFLMGWR